MGRVLRLALILGLVATACRAEFNFAIAIEETGAGTFQVEAGVDDELRELIPADGDPVELLLGSLDLSGFEGDPIEPYTAGDLTFQGFSGSFESLDELAVEFTQSPASPFTDFQFTLNDGGIKLLATLELPDLQAAVEASGLPVDPGLLSNTDLLASHVRLMLPGTVTIHDADRVLPSGELEWDLPLTGGTTQILAESRFDSGGIPFVTLLIAAGVLVAAVAGVLLVSRARRRREVEAVEAAVAAVPDRATGSFVPPDDFDPPGDAELAPDAEGGA